MKSLRSKLVVTFMAISVAGIMLAALFVRQANERAFDQLLQEQGEANFVRDALAYYETNGSWERVERMIQAKIPPPQPGQPPILPPPFALADADGRIVFPNGPFRPNSFAPAEAMERGIALEVDGARVGMALPINLPPPRDPVAEAYLAETNRALLIGALGATAVAVILGVIMARTLTRPLRELASASRQVAQGKLQQEVPVRTQDELGDLAAAFNQMSAELDRANQQRRQMTADIAHDLRTPLTVLSGYLEAMQDGTLPPTSARFDMMQQEVNTLKRLIADLRTLSLADAGNLTLFREPIPPCGLLTQAQSAYAHQAARQQVALRVDCPPELPEVKMDTERMRQVLGNLVSNALRHTPANGTITLAASRMTHDALCITVTDSGSGVPAADLPHIFNRFYRGDKSRQEGNGESGLGLAIVRSLVKAHGGEITAVSPVNPDGQGTQFTITLPL